MLSRGIVCDDANGSAGFGCQSGGEPDGNSKG